MVLFCDNFLVMSW